MILHQLASVRAGSQHIKVINGLPIMSANTHAAVGESKPVINNDNKPNINHARRGSNNSHRRDGYAKKDKFMGADPNLQGYAFEAKTSRAE